MRLLLFLVFLPILLTAQRIDENGDEYGGYFFGVKGGLTIGQQQWNNFQREPLFSYHGIGFIETLPEEGRFALFAQLGYHVKGSRIVQRNVLNPISGNIFRAPAESFEFNNLSLSIGGKQTITFTPIANIYYLLGVRLDYTVSTNLDEYNTVNQQFRLFYPIEDNQFLRRINYGVIAGGGFEFPWNERVAGVLEFTINPDFSLQYMQPQIDNIIDPFTSGTTSIPERNIRNLTFEITAGFKFLRKIVYLD